MGHDTPKNTFKKQLISLQGVSEEVAKDGKHIGVNCFVSGTIPPSAGLSSSSALVVAASLVTVWAHGLLDQISRSEIANLCARSERFIGTHGGGMDQAIQVQVSLAIHVHNEPQTANIKNAI